MDYHEPLPNNYSTGAISYPTRTRGIVVKYTIYQPRFQARQPSCLFLTELKKKMASTAIRRRNS